MIENYLIAPSLNSLFFTGMIALFIVFIFITNFKRFLRLNYFGKIQLLSLMGILFGVHGLIHLGVETTYNFNPYKWF